MADPADLSNLRDLVLPPDVLLWPPAPGWWILAGAALAAAAIVMAMAVTHYRRNAYRREALRLVATAEPAALPTVLKRAALAAWPREQVASLTGTAWLAFLDRTGRMTDFSAGPARALESLAFGGVVDAATQAAVRDDARHWLRRHHASGP